MRCTLLLFMLCAWVGLAYAHTPNLYLLRDVGCAIESRTYPNPSTVRSVHGARGVCQVLPATASWLASWAVRYGYLPLWAAQVQSPAIWDALLTVDLVNRAIALTYYRWMHEERGVHTARRLAYHYHAGHAAPWRKRSESWRHGAEVLLAYRAAQTAKYKRKEWTVYHTTERQ